MVELKTEAEVEAMAAAGAVVAEALRAVAEHARPGQSTTELDKVAADVLARHGARSPFLNYHPAWAPATLPRGAVRQRQRRRRARHPQRPGARRRRPGLASTSARPCAAGAATPRAASSSARHGRRTPRSSRRPTTPGGGHRGGTARQHARATSGTPSRRPPAARATACWPTTAGTASAAPCTRIRTCRTRGAPARACGCGRGW